MNFLDRLKYNFMNFMQGRYGGNDQLNRLLSRAALVAVILSFILRGWLMSLLVWLLLGASIFRMFSKNINARVAENQKYLEIKDRVVTEFRQAKARFKNRKEYKYFRCPKCKSRLKLRRGSGEGTIRCSHCGESFHVKA